METLSRNLSKSLGELVTSTDNHFSRGSGSIDDHDEDALRWAALEKLSTFARLRTTVIQPHNLVDVTKLGVDDRQKFIDSIFKVAEEDNEKFLEKLRKRIDRYLFYILVRLFFCFLRHATNLLAKRWYDSDFFVSSKMYVNWLFI